LRLLADGSSPWSEQAVVLSFEDGQASVAASRRLSLPVGDERAVFSIESAPAVATAFESKDPVAAFASAGQISGLLAEAFGGYGDGKAYLFPIVERQNVTAMLVAFGEVSPAPLELLCEAMGMRLDALAAQAAPSIAPLPSPVFVQIGGQSQAAHSGSANPKWDELSAEDKQLHLKAQRAARVRVAEMRLYEADALRKGAAAGDIYGALGTRIDAARTEFLQTFLSKSPTMVDYLHLEILRSLAHDNDRVLGEKYPGPMV
ncbi:MAG: hypothetical protein M3N54_10710, partial [Acidobacteriota bacterium]|nr:hypothetical protein [Acidobacteriota bacterium]